MVPDIPFVALPIVMSIGGSALRSELVDSRITSSPLT
jgi:hypothetical protein